MGSTMIMSSVFSSIANGIGELKVQAICFGLGAAMKVPLAFLFVKWMGTWTGVVLSNVVCVAVYCIAQPISFRLYFDNTQS